MTPFKQYLNEGKFRDSLSLDHLADVPMFSIFKDKGIEIDDVTLHDVMEAFKLAKKRINKMGFSSMHVNAVFRTYDPVKERNVLGMAQGNPEAGRSFKKLKSISLSSKHLKQLDTNYAIAFKKLVNTIVHEWGHIWMFNNGRTFRNAVKQYHEALVHSNIDKINLDYGDPIKVMKGIYDHLIYTTLPNLSKRPKKLAIVQDNVQNILLDKLEAFGKYAWAIDMDLIKRYANRIGTILVHDANNPSKAYRQLRALNMEKVFGDEIRKQAQYVALKKDPNVRQQLSDMVNFTGAYGLSNPDETWATALESFFKLDPYHRKRIFELMQTRPEPRLDSMGRLQPNARIQKHIKAKQREFLKNTTIDDLK